MAALHHSCPVNSDTPQQPPIAPSDLHKTRQNAYQTPTDPSGTLLEVWTSLADRRQVAAGHIADGIDVGHTGVLIPFCVLLRVTFRVSDLGLVVSG